MRKDMVTVIRKHDKPINTSNEFEVLAYVYDDSDDVLQILLDYVDVIRFEGIANPLFLTKNKGVSIYSMKVSELLPLTNLDAHHFPSIEEIIEELFPAGKIKESKFRDVGYLNSLMKRYESYEARNFIYKPVMDVIQTRINHCFNDSQDFMQTFTRSVLNPISESTICPVVTCEGSLVVKEMQFKCPCGVYLALQELLDKFYPGFSDEIKFFLSYHYDPGYSFNFTYKGLQIFDRHIPIKNPDDIDVHTGIHNYIRDFEKLRNTKFQIEVK